MNEAARSVAQALSDALGEQIELRCALRSGRCETSSGPMFIKLGPSGAADMFDAEAAGLRALAAANAVRTPRVFASGSYAEGAFIALEWLELRSPSRACESNFGEQLAAQHGVMQSQFGWERNNTIGATDQINTPHPDWSTFFREQRLRFQLDLARRNGADAALYTRGERLCDELGAFFVGHRPGPSLLHGDLWGGNWGADAQDRPVIFDPAVYFGDREADLAMTRLFGGFGAGFYAAYEAAWPLNSGAKARATLYNLYHVLNHFNLFGGAYLAQARAMIDKLLAEAGA